MNMQEMAMGASSVQLRIWAVGIATTLLVAAAGAGMGPLRLSHDGASATLTGSSAGAHPGAGTLTGQHPEQSSTAPAETTR
jgi:hypothetical protein